MKKQFFAVAALLMSSYSWAQDSSARILDEVIVTSNKFPQKQSTTGKVIAVINKDQLEKSNGKSLTTLLNEQAGITVNGSLNNAGTNQSVYMRGAATGRTLILIDGIPVYDPSLINNEFDLNLIAIEELERIEICRGAQSTLYGSDAVAGVINLITQKKDLKQPLYFKGSLGLNRYRTLKSSAQAYGKLGKLRYSARYSRLSSDGFSAAKDSLGGQGFDQDRYRGDVVNLALQYQAAPAIGVRSFWQQSKYRNAIDAGIFADEKDYFIKNKNTIAGAGFLYHKDNVRITGNYQYSDIYRNYRNDSADVPGFSKFSTDDYYGRTQFVELFANIGVGHGISLLQGADYRFSSMNNQFFSLSSFGPFQSEFSDTVQSQASLFVSAVYNSVNERLNIELGARLNVHSRYGNNSTYTFNPSYSFGRGWRIFGSLATGFKAPSLYQLYGQYGDYNLKPETSKNYEIGLQQQQQQLSNRLVYFFRDIRNGLDFDYINYQYFNFLRQEVSGLEYEGSLKLAMGFSVDLNYTWLKAKEKTQSRISFADTSYRHLLRRPEHQANLRLGYQINKALYVSLSGKYVSSRFDMGGYQQADIRLAPYTILNAYAAYQLIRQLKVYADIQNLTDKRFMDIYGFNSIPFMAGLGIVLSF